VTRKATAVEDVEAEGAVAVSVDAVDVVDEAVRATPAPLHQLELPRRRQRSEELRVS
jgi:hypothetical protein